MTNPNKKQKLISTNEKIEVAILKLEEYHQAVQDTIQMLREIKRESLRPPTIAIPEVTFSDSSLPVTPNYSGVSPQCENFITAPRQFIDGSQVSKRVFPDGNQVIDLTCTGCEDNEPNQMAHACLGYPSETELIDYSGMDGKIRAFYGCRIVKFQAVVRGGLVRRRLWREKVTNASIKFQALVRGWLARKLCTKHDLIPVRSGYDHTTYECSKCDYESGSV